MIIRHFNRLSRNRWKRRTKQDTSRRMERETYCSKHYAGPNCPHCVKEERNAQFALDEAKECLDTLG